MKTRIRFIFVRQSWLSVTAKKGIVIGKQGSMLKKIGTLARKDIEVMLGDKVFLETWVKVKKNWRDKKLDLADFGYNEKEY